MSRVGEIALPLAVAGAGLTGGVYVAFSVMVMPALRRRPVAEAIGTMQRINELALRAPFMTLFFGSAAAAAVVIVDEARSGSGGEALLRIGGAGLALLAFASTAGYNVPRNNRIAALVADDPGAASEWARLEREWSRGNHLRALASIGSAAAILASMSS